MKKRTFKLLEKPPTTNKEKIIGDIWFAKVPYKEKGNWYKPRPVLIYAYDNEKYICRKITTKPKGKPIQFKNSKPSYVSKYDIILKEEMFYSLIQRGIEYEKYL